MNSYALVPNIIDQSRYKFISEIFFLICGVFLVSVMAQITISLPWTPVPITGQTFGVTLMALTWGGSRSFRVLLTYLFIGGMGLPVFAMGKSGLGFGPTLGYLIGMLISSFVVGSLADRGFIRSFFHSWLAAICGSFVVFTCGLAVLSFFVPKESLLMAGLIPFLLGDLIKNTLAALMASKIRKAFN